MKTTGSNIFDIVCNECEYHGTTDIVQSFPTGLKNYSIVKYVCPACGSKDIEYKPRANMKWLAWMSRTKELRKMQKNAVAKRM